MTTTCNPGPTCTPRRFEIYPRIGEITTRAPAASREDSCSQAILKFHHPSSLDYRARHGLPAHQITIIPTSYIVSYNNIGRVKNFYYNVALMIWQHILSDLPILWWFMCFLIKCIYVQLGILKTFLLLNLYKLSHDQ